MSTKLKLYLGRKVLDCLHKSTKFSQCELQPLIEIGSNKTQKIEFNLPLHTLETQLGITNVNEILKIQPDDIIRNVKVHQDRANRMISFEIDQKIFVKDILDNNVHPSINMKTRNIVVEYSSPNVAKPFHLGHLRSTIIGNFISNLNLYIKNKVTRINYLGDWGTQFGFIRVGIDELKYSSKQIKENPLKALYESYVHANALAEKDPNILVRAKNEFSKLENGSKEALDNWNTILNYTKAELENTYNRLGVKFDEYNYESMYSAKQILAVIELLKKNKVLEKDKEGREVVKMNDRSVSVIKSDGSTLYITRDIAAAIDRYEKFKFDKMYYIVDNAQTDHFNSLKYIINRMHLPWSDRLVHVKYGRIRGMSTRKGTAVFLNDILNESRDLMIQRQLQSPTTKVPIDDGKISDILGVSCVIVNDLKQRRQKDYEFDWDKVLQVQGDTGIKLQYTHCRLCNLEKNSGNIAAQTCNPEVLTEFEIITLLKEIVRFQDVIYKANEQLESCVLVTYLFHLCNHINRALKVIQVKGMSPDIASQRLLVFNKAREVLKTGMNILGLQPLTEM